MDTLILSGPDIRRLVAHVGLDTLMDTLIERLTQAFEGYDAQTTRIPIRSGFSYDHPASGLVEWMPCLGASPQGSPHVAIKVVGYHPENPARHELPTILSTVSAYDTATGHLLAMMDGTFLTALRTGAASALATEALAVPEADTVGLIGTGAQAVTQLHALTRVRPIRRVLAYDVQPGVLASFPQRIARFGAHLTVETASAEAIVEQADIICTATSIEVGAGPVFGPAVPKPWAHFNAVGSDFPGKTELPADLLRQSFVCPDFRAQAIQEGECQQIDAEQIGPSLYEVLQQPDRYADQRQRLTVFDSTGWALEDHVALHLFLSYAAELGLGTRLPIESIWDDPHAPYALASTPTLATTP
ncbi:MAG: ornithine cyclodeaminase family protein [Bacteroidota bacterium]